MDITTLPGPSDAELWDGREAHQLKMCAIVAPVIGPYRAHFRLNDPDLHECWWHPLSATWCQHGDVRAFPEGQPGEDSQMMRQTVERYYIKYTALRTTMRRLVRMMDELDPDEIKNALRKYLGQ